MQVTDFLPQERERGITIKAAAITFGWKGHTVNLIDTPGHVDFTCEVERSFRVLDGAVLLYDAVSGVEAQSETVWTQACRYGVAKIAFANKMDREGASYGGTAAAIQGRLGANPLLVHVPLGEAGGFAGVVDLVGMRLHAASDKDGKQAWDLPVSALFDTNSSVSASAGAGLGVQGDRLLVPGRADGDGPLSLRAADVREAIRAGREALFEVLSEADDGIAEAYLAAMDAGSGGGDPLLSSATPGLQPADVHAAIRRAVCKPGTPILPLLAGSAYKNKGVQLLLDSVCGWLPSPLDRPPVTGTDLKTGKQVALQPTPDAPLRALAFKVQNHPSRGPLVYFRVYSGVLTRSLPLLNTSATASATAAAAAAAAASGKESSSGGGSKGHEGKERAGKLLQIFADEQREVEAVGAGHIGAATGLKGVRTGDTLCHAGDPHPVLLPRLTLPQPVFTASLEVGSASEQKALEEALAVLVREDPSLHVRTNEDTGQLLLSGMGELHLDVAADRLRREYGVPVQLGRMQVAYRESVSGEGEGSFVLDRALGTTGKRQWATLAVKVERLEDATQNVFVQAQEHIRCKYIGSVDEGSGSSGGGGGGGGHGKGGKKGSAPAAADDGSGLKLMPAALADAVREAITTALGRGPLLGYPLTGLRVSLLEEGCEISSDSNAAAVKEAAVKALAAAITAAGAELLEPCMNLEAVVPDAAVGSIVTELSSQRRGRIREVESAATAAAAAGAGATGTTGATATRGHVGKTVIRALVPLRELVGYSTVIRSKTAGEGSFSMEFAAYEPLSPQLQKAILADPSSA